MEVILNVLNSQNKYQFDWSLSALISIPFVSFQATFFQPERGWTVHVRWFMDVTTWRRCLYSHFRSSPFEGLNWLFDCHIIETLSFSPAEFSWGSRSTWNFFYRHRASPLQEFYHSEFFSNPDSRFYFNPVNGKLYDSVLLIYSFNLNNPQKMKHRTLLIQAF